MKRMQEKQPSLTADLLELYCLTASNLLICGSVQLIFVIVENHPHYGNTSKT